MPHYFLDTSALAKLYRKELGSDLVDRIVAEQGSRRFISRFTPARNGIGSRAQVPHGRDRGAIVDDRPAAFASRPRQPPAARRHLSDDHLRGARQLLIGYGRTEALRGPDALQLSIALGLKRAGLVSVFVAADQKLCRVAMIEGFTTLNPEQPITL